MITWATPSKAIDTLAEQISEHFNCPFRHVGNGRFESEQDDRACIVLDSLQYAEHVIRQYQTAGATPPTPNRIRMDFARQRQVRTQHLTFALIDVTPTEGE